MNPSKMLIGLAPWLLFSLLVRIPADHVAGPAALAAALASVTILLWQSRDGLKIIDLTSALTFGVLSLVAFKVTGGGTWIIDYGRATAAVVLAAVMLISAATVPFTEQYARASVPEAAWRTPTFRAVNRRISALWGVIMLVLSGCHLLAAALLQETGQPAGQNLLNWGLPVLLVIVGIKQTRRLAAAARPAGAALDPVSR